MKNLYNITVGQLITLWVFGGLVAFWAFDNESFYLLTLIAPLALIFYTIGWRAKHQTESKKGKSENTTFRWFETEEILRKESLNKEEIDYIEAKTITFLGPLNIFVRKQWDIVAIFLAVNVADRIILEMYPESWTIFDWISLAVWLWMIWFSILHSRRLAWNRNEWESFKSFKNSENKWKPWSYLMIILATLMIVGGLVGY